MRPPSASTLQRLRMTSPFASRMSNGRSSPARISAVCSAMKSIWLDGTVKVLAFAPVIHQPDEGRFALRDLVGQSPEPAERAVDELRAHLGIEQHDADLGLVERGAQRCQLLVGDLLERDGAPCAVQQDADHHRDRRRADGQNHEPREDCRACSGTALPARKTGRPPVRTRSRRDKPGRDAAEIGREGDRQERDRARVRHAEQIAVGQQDQCRQRERDQWSDGGAPVVADHRAPPEAWGWRSGLGLTEDNKCICASTRRCDVPSFGWLASCYRRAGA